MIQKFRLDKIIIDALDEDIGSGDVTTLAVLTGNEVGTAEVFAKDDIIVAGIDVFKEVFLLCDKDICFVAKLEDGQPAGRGDILAEISGKLKNILTAERVALNFLQRMCGIATLTRKYVAEISGTGVRILDTRKTLPCHRLLDKYAVKTGGGFNHRFGLYDGVMIKDNHIKAAGGILKAVEMISSYVPPTLNIEVEVKTLGEVEEALSSGVDIIMLDNMNVEDMKKAVSMINGRVLVEASGNVTLANVREIAETGVDFISVGTITHSVPAADISLLIK